MSTGYRIMEIEQGAPDILERATEVAVFDSAYRAAEEMKRVMLQRGSTPRWYLVDPWGQMLMGPDDLCDVAA